MTTLLLSRRYSNDSNSIWKSAIDLGWNIERLMTYEVSKNFRHEEIVLYGETILADTISQSFNIEMLEPTYDWLSKLPYKYRKREIELTTLGEARKLSNKRFVKPVDEKIFPARVYSNGGEIDPTNDFEDSNLVLIQEPVEFALEIRAFILNRKIETFSAYIRDGEIAQENDWELCDNEELMAIHFLETMLNDSDVELPAAVVIDIGSIKDKGWAVVEANACWAAGICGCNPTKILEVIKRASVPANLMTEEDWKWSRLRHRENDCIK